MDWGSVDFHEECVRSKKSTIPGGASTSGRMENQGPQGYLWVKSSSFDRRTPCGQTVDFTPPSLAA
jgi:hypothetical protein